MWQQMRYVVITDIDSDSVYSDCTIIEVLFQNLHKKNEEIMEGGLALDIQGCFIFLPVRCCLMIGSRGPGSIPGATKFCEK
jgi:hypothetical protein